MPNTSSCISGTVLGAPRMIWGRLEDWDDGDRNSERATRHAENALLRGDAGRKSSRVDHRRIGRRRLPADQLVQVARSIRIRFGLITTPFRSSVRHFWTTSQRNSGSLFRCSEPASVAESRPVQEWLRRGRDLRGMNLHRRLLIGNPNA